MIQFFLDAFFKALRDPSFQGTSGLIIAFIGGIIIPSVFPARPYRRGKIAHMHIVVGKIMQSHPTHGSGPFHRIRWKLWNDGNKPIEPKDYRKDPIEFIFGNTAFVQEVKVVKSRMALSPIRKGNKCELAPVFLDRGYPITLEFLVKNADIKNTKIELILAGHDPIDVIARGSIFIKIALSLLVLWTLTFIAHWRLPQLASVYYILIGLAFFISLLGTRGIIYLVSSLLP